MGTGAQQIDMTTLIAALQAMTQVLGLNGRSLEGIFAGEFLPARWTHIASSGTFMIQGTAGALLTLNINTPSTSDTVAIYDAATTTIALPGTLLVANLTLQSGAPNRVSFGSDDRGLTLNNGLVIVTSGTSDITIGHL